MCVKPDQALCLKFTNDEILVLLKLIRNRKKCILKKETDAATIRAQDRAWLKINKILKNKLGPDRWSSDEKRNKDALLKFWERIKRDAIIYYKCKYYHNESNKFTGDNRMEAMESICAILAQESQQYYEMISKIKDLGETYEIDEEIDYLVNMYDRVYGTDSFGFFIDDPFGICNDHIDISNLYQTDSKSPEVTNEVEKEFAIENNEKPPLCSYNLPPSSSVYALLCSGLMSKVASEITGHMGLNICCLRYLDEEVDEGMEEGQEEWLSEGVLTDDDFVPSAEHDKSDSNLITSEDHSQSQDSENIVQTTVVIGKVEQPILTPVRNIEQQLTDLESTRIVAALPDDLDAFLIRKTDGKVLEAKIKDEPAMTKAKAAEDDGNDTDDLLRMLGEGDQKVKKKTLKMMKSDKNEEQGSSDDDDYIYERSQVKTLKIAKNALIKRPATKAVPEDMSDEDDNSEQSSDGSTMQRMFEVKKPSSADKKEASKKIVKHVVQVSSSSNKSQTSESKTIKQSQQKPNILRSNSKNSTTQKPTIQKPATQKSTTQTPATQTPTTQKTSAKSVEVKTLLKSVEVKNSAPSKSLDKTSKDKLKSEVNEETLQADDLDEIIDEEEFLEEDDFDLDEEEFGEESEADESKKQRLMQPEMMDEEVPSDAESHSEDGSLYDELPSSDSEDLDDWFTLDIRAERAGDYLPLLGSKARELLIAEQRRVSARVTTLRQSLSALTDSARRQADQLRAAAMALAEIDDTLKAA